MAFRMPNRLRTIVLLLALVAMLGVSAASATPAHFHADSSGDSSGSSGNRCDLCFTAHMSVVQSPAVQPIHGIELQGRVPVVLPFFGYRPYRGRTACSRGPPSL